MSLRVGFVLPAALPVFAIAEALVQRLCRSARAGAEPAFRATGAHRFDDPAGRYGTLYCAPDFGTCFIETLLRGAASLTVRRVEYHASSVVLLLLDAKRLVLVDLFSTPAVASLGLDLGILTGTSYTDTQQLSGMIHRHPQKPHGIVYRSRFDPDRPAIVLFDGAKRLVRRFPGCTPRPLPAVPQLSDGVRNRVPFVFI